MTRLTVAAGVGLVAACVSTPARAGLAADADTVTASYRESATVSRPSPRLFSSGPSVALALPLDATWTAKPGCTTVVVLGAVSTAFALAAPAEGGDTSQPDQVVAGVAGLAQVSRCGAERAKLAALSLEVRSPHAIIELVVATSRAPLLDARTLLPHRDPGRVSALARPGPPPSPGPLGNRVMRLENRLARDDAGPIEHRLATTDASGAGRLSFELDPGCHRLTVLAAPTDPNDDGFLDVDAELAWSSGEIAASDHTDSPDASLMACNHAKELAVLAFAGAAPNGSVLVVHARTELPAGIPGRWGAGAARVARSLLERRIPAPTSLPVYESLGVGGITALPVELEPGRCYLSAVAALQGDIKLLSMSALSDGQTTLAHVDDTEVAAVVTFCAGTTPRGRLEVEVHGNSPILDCRAVARGRATARTGVTMTARCALGVALAAALASGCVRSPRVPVAGPSAEASDELATRWLGPDIEKAARSGAGAATILAAGAGAPGDSIGGRITLGTADCVVFLARGSRSIEDLDLFVYGDDGALLGGDETASENASAVVCPPHPQRIYAFARVAAGRGVFALSAQVAKPAAAERAARAVGAAGKLHEQALAGGWPGLEEALAEHRRVLGGKWKETRRVAVPLDPRVPTRTSGVLEAGQCLDVLVLPSDEVAFVELTAQDPLGRIVGRARTEDRWPSLHACAASYTELTLELRPHAGRGLAAVILSTTDNASALAAASGTILLDAPESDPRAAQAFAHEMTRLGYPAPSSVAHGTTGVGRRVSTAVDLPEGCSRLDVFAADPMRGVDAWLWDENGALLAHADGGSRATLFGCGKRAHARLDVEAIAHPGPFSAELRATPTVPVSLAQHPLAAARLLGRLAEAGRIGTPRELAAPRVVVLSDARLVTDDMTVPVGQCLDVGLALGAGAEGAELRLVDAEANEELMLARGTYSVLAEACAVDRAAPLQLRIELRAAAGAADALLGVHPRAYSKPRGASVPSP